MANIKQKINTAKEKLGRTTRKATLKSLIGLSVLGAAAPVLQSCEKTDDIQIVSTINLEYDILSKEKGESVIADIFMDLFNISQASPYIRGGDWKTADQRMTQVNLKINSVDSVIFTNSNVLSEFAAMISGGKEKNVPSGNLDGLILNTNWGNLKTIIIAKKNMEAATNSDGEPINVMPDVFEYISIISKYGFNVLIDTNTLYPKFRDRAPNAPPTKKGKTYIPPEFYGSKTK